MTNKKFIAWCKEVDKLKKKAQKINKLTPTLMICIQTRVINKNAKNKNHKTTR